MDVGYRFSSGRIRNTTRGQAEVDYPFSPHVLKMTILPSPRQ